MNGPNESHQRLSCLYELWKYKSMSHFRQAVKETMPKAVQGKTIGYFIQEISQCLVNQICFNVTILTSVMLHLNISNLITCT